MNLKNSLFPHTKRIGLFSSFLQGGFECSTHRTAAGRRVDVAASSFHEKFLARDYKQLQRAGIRTVREGSRWHIIETAPGQYDFSSLERLYDAAQEAGTQIILDLFHFGWPDHIDFFSPDFVTSFSEYAFRIAKLLKIRGLATVPVIPVNEISFFAWGAGDAGFIFPCALGRGAEVKLQLVRTAIAATRVLQQELSNVLLVSAEPAIHIVDNPLMPHTKGTAEPYRMAMYEAWDMLTGRIHPELGGRPEYLDVVGLNFYDRNEWVNNGEILTKTDSRFRPLRRILQEAWDRYSRPLLVSETGTEDYLRAEWFQDIAVEVDSALAAGIPVQGICLYPIVNHPGWDDDRHCHNGLFDYPDDNGHREPYLPLLQAIEQWSQQSSTQDIFEKEVSMNKPNPDLICFSHLRWQFVFQRPQHLMARFAASRRVFFFEEPIFESDRCELRTSVCPKTGVRVVTPVLPQDGLEDRKVLLTGLFASLLKNEEILDYVAWFYTPMALGFCGDQVPLAVVYDCMDELSLFKGAPPAMVGYEAKLFAKADVVFTGGHSLFEAKRNQHSNIHAFPSSVDVGHFAQARTITESPADQREIPRPRIGYAGVIDERMDLELLRAVAEKRPEWHLVLLGPVVKIDPATLPVNANIHYLGMKQYSELPAYFSGWDVAMLPFALNESTRFISPTKTPEYLAAHLPVVSTPIRDVVRDYGPSKLIEIAGVPDDFIASIERSLVLSQSSDWKHAVDKLLAASSWDKTWAEMNTHLIQAMNTKLSMMANRVATGAGLSYV